MNKDLIADVRNLARLTDKGYTIVGWYTYVYWRIDRGMKPAAAYITTRLALDSYQEKINEQPH